MTNTVRCDAFGCRERHPLNHKEIGKPGFALGKWLGWVYLDINRPDLIDRPLRFCSVLCLEHWLRMNAEHERRIGRAVGDRRK